MIKITKSNYEIIEDVLNQYYPAYCTSDLIAQNACMSKRYAEMLIREMLETGEYDIQREKIKTLGERSKFAYRLKMEN